MLTENTLEKNMKSMKRFSILSLTLAGLLFCGTVAKADTITFTIAPAVQNALPGDTLAFDATVSLSAAATGPVFLNGDSFTLDSGFTLNDNPFWSNFPFELLPGDSVTAELFTLTVLPGTLAGAHIGTFEILGGSSNASQDVLGAPSFTVNVDSSVTPEPSSLVLLASGLVGLAGTYRRRLMR